MTLFKKILLVVPAIMLSFSAMAEHVQWKADATQKGDALWEVTVTATIGNGWHIYDLGPYDGGPVPTSFEISGEGITPAGEITPSAEPHRTMDETFGMEIGWWEKEISLTQTVKCKNPGTAAKVKVEWMACDSQNCTPPDEWEAELVLGEVEAAAGNNGLWALILEAILWGLVAILTPCVFPIIPMTVSFFIKGEYGPARNRFRALMYGVFIIALYTVPIAVIILTTRVMGGASVTADIFNWVSTHWLPNILFFLIFMVFSASFFGAFEIVLPSKLQNSSDAQVDKRRGLGGVFFLALTLVLVSFSCTGPIVGTVLIKSTSGEFWAPIATMLAFSFAFAIPFVLCAMFPGMLKRLPKSGGWLNTVKVVLGFIEIALGFKFLSTADMVYHWGILDREVYLAVWITVFTLLGFYLLGKITFKYDSPVSHIGFGRLALTIADFAFVVYMIPGMWGAPLKALSGYLPPMETQDFILTSGVTEAPMIPFENSTSGNIPGHGKYSDILKLPHPLRGFFDLEEALSYAKEVGKPVFLDFTGHGCVNCREMEAKVWSAPEVLKRLSENFIICALYTDDKMKVAPQDIVTTEEGKVLKTLGKINAYRAEKDFGVASQPYYLILSPEGKVLRSRGYNLDVEAFIRWLDM